MWHEGCRTSGRCKKGKVFQDTASLCIMNGYEQQRLCPGLHNHLLHTDALQAGPQLRKHLLHINQKIHHHTKVYKTSLGQSRSGLLHRCILLTHEAQQAHSRQGSGLAFQEEQGAILQACLIPGIIGDLRLSQCI